MIEIQINRMNPLLYNDLLPSFIKDYKLISILGHGGFGYILKISDRSTGQIHALKLIHKASSLPLVYTAVTDSLIPLEAHIMRHYSSHEAITSLNNLYEDDRYWYLVTEMPDSPWRDRCTEGNPARPLCECCQEKPSDLFEYQQLILDILSQSSQCRLRLRSKYFVKSSQLLHSCTPMEFVMVI